MNVIPFLVSPENMSAYEALVRNGRSSEVPTTEKMVELVTTRKVLAWWYLEGEEKAGWCALAPNHGHYAPGAWHFYCSWVRPGRSCEDIAKALWRLRLAIVPAGTSVSVCIVGEDAITENLVEKFGFKKLTDFPDQPGAYLLKKA